MCLYANGTRETRRSRVISCALCVSVKGRGRESAKWLMQSTNEDTTWHHLIRDHETHCILFSPFFSFLFLVSSYSSLFFFSSSLLSSLPSTHLDLTCTFALSLYYMYFFLCLRGVKQGEEKKGTEITDKKCLCSFLLFSSLPVWPVYSLSLLVTIHLVAILSCLVSRSRPERVPSISAENRQQREKQKRARKKGKKVKASTRRALNNASSHHMSQMCEWKTKSDIQSNSNKSILLFLLLLSHGAIAYNCHSSSSSSLLD